MPWQGWSAAINWRWKLTLEQRTPPGSLHQILCAHCLNHNNTQRQCTSCHCTASLQPYFRCSGLPQPSGDPQICACLEFNQHLIASSLLVVSLLHGNADHVVDWVVCSSLLGLLQSRELTESRNSCERTVWALRCATFDHCLPRTTTSGG